jgi:hypothetical protein
MIKVTVTKKDMTKELLADLQKKQIAFVAKGGQEIGKEMKLRVNAPTGKTRDSIETDAYVTDGGAESETGPNGLSKIPLYLEYGTGVHAEHGDGRKTPWGPFMTPDGEWRFTHGMEARPFAEPGFQAAKPEIDRMAETDLRA